jgi:hypothetical protein
VRIKHPRDLNGDEREGRVAPSNLVAPLGVNGRACQQASQAHALRLALPRRSATTLAALHAA